MKQKSIKVWQFVVLIVLLVAMLSTMFMPAFRFNGAVIKEMEQKALGVFGNSQFTDILGTGQLSEEEIDEDIAEMKKEGINLNNISPFSLMTFSFAKFVDEDGEIDEDTRTIMNGYNSFRIPLIIIYVVTLLMLIFVIISYLTKMNKIAPLSACITYGVISGCVFGFLRFGLFGMIGKKIANTMGNLGALFGSGVGNDTVNLIAKYMRKVLSPLNSVAFLIAMILAIVLVIVSIVCIFVGKSVYADIPDGYGWTGGPNDWMDGPDAVNTPSGPVPYHGPGGTPVTVVQPVPNGGQGSGIGQGANPASGFWGGTDHVIREEKTVDVKPFGVVQCIKGVSIGQGFRIPADCKVVIGKSAQRANFIINDPKISNVHCSIRFNPENASYVVTDHSSNGTYVNGNRLQKDVAVLFKAGTVISLAGDENQIKLG